MAEPGDIAITVGALHKRFAVRGWRPGRPRGTVEALRGVELTVRRGTIHGVIGPNGSGKSTLLRVLATLIIPDTGTAAVNGFDVEQAPLDARRQIGFTTGEERSVYWRLTARQNLEFAAALHRLRDADARIASALEVAGLADAADRSVSGFSQGMARRLGLARAMLHQPSVLLLDEPTRSLDPVARDEFHAAAVGQRDSQHTTILLTTHDLAEAASMCDEVSVLREGRIIADVVPTSEGQLQDELRKVAS
ncbi:MAG: type transport system ATP-binding protein [Acidimicrobiaceae bacterium]